ncbi:homoserine O-succinyltransferase [Atopobacter sp. AH10]|uniref:homoserine O-acetyltransferase/O-succinyltransferase family protein n=1 Tax=Atopobacter sp. AH10 TaxID=2315861 RepID=UPI000EF28E1C|nr:homoserine O-succinyltransferase [Atopobacter sp. AH10]RLK63381.1 homoserine O-succinyltransferase [Atopobacter sp. AH10]
MPVILPENLIDTTELLRRQIFAIDQERAHTQDIRPLRIAIVNLMPNKEETELQLLQLLSGHALQIEVDFIRTETYQSKHADLKRLGRYYRTYQDIKDEKYDGMIITGAPLERFSYDDIAYWKELEQLFEYARSHVYSTIFICWAAQAALHYYYNIHHLLETEKIFGIYPFKKIAESPLLYGMDDIFYIPQSRYTRIEADQLEAVPDLDILATSPETGVVLAATQDQRFIFSLGHLEYDKETLHREYVRDLEKNLPIKPPIHYYRKVGQADSIDMLWKSTASLFFGNWVNYAVYQNTPYQLKELEVKSVAKFGGSSLSDANQFRKVKKIIEGEENRQIVVVSAPGKRNPLDVKVTDLLINVDQANQHKREIEEEISQLQKKVNGIENDRNQSLERIHQRFLEIIQSLSLDSSLDDVVKDCLEKVKVSDSYDYILSRGEYLNAQLLANYLHYDFVDAQDLIVFDGDKVDLPRSYELINQHIQAKQKVVVPGFYGSRDGKVKVFWWILE